MAAVRLGAVTGSVGNNVMRRREFVTLLAGAACASPQSLSAQTPPRMLRVGLVSSTNPRTAPQYVAFDQRLREFGYIEGQNLAIEFILLNGQVERYGEAMNELVRRKVDVIIAFGQERALKAAMAATETIPIVMVALDYDPFALGYATSLPRPTSNVTGVFVQQIELAAKRIQLMKEAFSDLSSATVFWDGASADQWRATQTAAPSLSLSLVGVELRDRPYDYERALAETPVDHQSALIVMNSPTFFIDRERLAQFALQHRMASMFAWREWVQAGGLMSYGPSFVGIARRAAEYVDRIARGAKPADLPIEQPTTFDLIINIRTAKALGLTLPRSILARADEVIE
jgi:putative tryptophan/tyrosine transport system substrate-binding protein